MILAPTPAHQAAERQGLFKNRTAPPKTSIPARANKLPPQYERPQYVSAPHCQEKMRPPSAAHVAGAMPRSIHAVATANRPIVIHTPKIGWPNSIPAAS